MAARQGCKTDCGTAKARALAAITITAASTLRGNRKAWQSHAVAIAFGLP
jgi:hypothetical protein